MSRCCETAGLFFVKASVVGTWFGKTGEELAITLFYAAWTTSNVGSLIIVSRGIRKKIAIMSSTFAVCSRGSGAPISFLPFTGDLLSGQIFARAKEKKSWLRSSYLIFFSVPNRSIKGLSSAACELLCELLDQIVVWLKGKLYATLQLTYFCWPLACMKSIKCIIVSFTTDLFGPIFKVLFWLIGLWPSGWTKPLTFSNSADIEIFTSMWIYNRSFMLVSLSIS